MHDRERREVNLASVQHDREPALFVLETVYEGDIHVVADGVAFPPPNEQVVVQWRTTESTELIDTVEALYEKFGSSPRVMWRHDEEVLTEAEPTEFIQSYSEVQ